MKWVNFKAGFLEICMGSHQQSRLSQNTWKRLHFVTGSVFGRHCFIWAQPPWFQFYHFRRLTIQKQETRHLAHPIFQTSIGKTGIAQIANIDLHGLHFATLGVLDKKNGMPYASRSANPQSTSTKLRSYTPWTPWFTILPHSELYVTKQKRMGCLACPFLSTLDRRARNLGVTHHGLRGLWFCHIQSLKLLNKKNGTSCMSRFVNLGSTSTQLGGYTPWTPWFMILPHSELEVTKQKKWDTLHVPFCQPCLYNETVTQIEDHQPQALKLHHSESRSLQG